MNFYYHSTCVLALDFDTEHLVGPWVVRTDIVPEDAEKLSLQAPETLLNKKAVVSMENFMSGEVEYFVSAPVDRPLVFRSFSKADRPRAWKGCDLRIQTTIPVLGVDSSVSKDDHSGGREGSDKSERLIRVSMKLRSSDGE